MCALLYVSIELFSRLLYLQDGSDLLYGWGWPQNFVSFFLEKIYVEAILHFSGIGTV